MNQHDINEKITKAFRSVCEKLDLSDKQMVVDPYSHPPYMILHLDFEEFRNETGKRERMYWMLKTSGINQIMFIDFSMAELESWIKQRILRCSERNNKPISNSMLSVYSECTAQ